MAASILQHSMAGIKDEDTYISSMDINVEHCSEYVPSIMHDFVMWCVKGSTFENVSRSCDEGQKKWSQNHVYLSYPDKPVWTGVHAHCTWPRYSHSPQLRKQETHKGTAFPWVLCLIWLNMRISNLCCTWSEAWRGIRAKRVITSWQLHTCWCRNR